MQSRIDETPWQSKMRAAAIAERERCAKICDEIAADAWALWKLGGDPTEQGRCIGAEQCAQAIRATITP